MIQLKKYTLHFFILCLLLFEIAICIYSINKGASNTDEFTTILYLRNQKNMIKVDFYNMILIITDFFFHPLTILNLRKTKFLFIGISTCSTCILLFPILYKKYQLESKYFFLITFIFVTGSIITVFNRSISYNDIMDHFSVLIVCILFNLLYFTFSWIRFFILSTIYIFCTFFLFGIKLPLGLLAILLFIYSIFKFLPISLFQKIIASILFLILFMLVEYQYIQYFYADFNSWLNTLFSIKEIFYGEEFPIYLIDIIGFLCIIFIIFRYYNSITKKAKQVLQHKNNTLSNMIKSIAIIIALAIFIITCLVVHSFYVFYYLLPSVTFIFILIYTYVDAIKYLFKQRKFCLFNQPDNFVLLMAIVLFLSCLFGSYTLQLINVILHPYLVGLLIVLVLIRRQRIILLKTISVYLFLLFIMYNIFNPFLYSNTTLFNQNKKIFLKSTDEHIYVSDAVKEYFNKINKAIGCCDKNKSILNIDFSNVAYYTGYVPYLLPNIVDEQSSTIFRNELKVIKKLDIKQAAEPKWMLTANNTNTNFYLHLKNDRNLIKDSLILKIKDPSSNIFKNLKSDNCLYIYTVKKVDN